MPACAPAPSSQRGHRDLHAWRRTATSSAIPPMGKLSYRFTTVVAWQSVAEEIADADAQAAARAVARSGQPWTGAGRQST
jgi:hypothetical protein